MPRIRKAFDVNVNQAYRLIVTELARVQTDAQMKSFKKNGFGQYTFHALGNACDLCKELDGKHFNVEDGESGKNMPQCIHIADVVHLPIWTMKIMRLG